MPDDSRRVIRTVDDARERIGAIVAEINARPDLARAAAVNPILAIEYLDYEVHPEARVDIEDLVRFGPARARRLKELRARIFSIAGRAFDLQSEEELRRFLVELNVRGPAPGQGYPTYDRPVPAGARLILPPQVGWGQPVADPLEGLRDAHPLMPVLLEYRRLEASKPRLGSRELYEQVRLGTRRTPIKGLRAQVRAGRGKPEPS